MDIISVVVVVYNSASTIVETLESVKRQTYPKLELVVTDDCSSDNSVDIIKQWIINNKKRFVKCRIIANKTNHGITQNCNIGIGCAIGKYVQELSGDDLLVDNAIQKKYEYAQINHSNIVFSKVEPFGVNIKNVNEMKKYCQKYYEIAQQSWKTQYKQILRENFFVAASGAFYLKSYFDKKGKYDKRYKMMEDYPFILKYIAEGNKISVLDETLIRYRVSDNSITGQRSKTLMRDCMKFYFLVRLPKMIKERMYMEAYDQFRKYVKYIIEEGW